MNTAETIQTLLQGFTTARTRINAERSEAGPVPNIARPYYSAADKAASAMATTLTSAHNTAARLAADDTLFPAGRDRQIRQLLANAEQRVTELHGQITGNAELAHAILIGAAMPAPPTGSSAANARTDALMILNGAKEKETMLCHLARRNDNVGALVVSQWGRDYLMSLGLEGRWLDEGFEAVRAFGLEAALKSDDRDRARAAAHALNSSGLHQLGDGGLQTASAAIDYMRTAWKVTTTHGDDDPNAPAAPSFDLDAA